MAERIRPATDFKVAGTVTGRTRADQKNESNPPRQDLGKLRAQGALDDGFGQPVMIQPFGGCQMSYRAKPCPGGEHRRYYIGFVQFGFVRKDPDGFIVHLTGQDDAPAGTRLASEQEVEKFLRDQLVAA